MEILVRGGKYLSCEGGSRPTFKSGGTQLDAIRNAIGNFMTQVVRNLDNSGSTLATYEGAVDNGYVRDPATAIIQSGTATSAAIRGARINLANVVPTAADNRVRTISDRWWRRVA
jgi:hypothetical protein